MKKILAFILAVCLFVPMTCAFAESGDNSGLPFTPVLTPGVLPKSATEIVTNKTNRAMLTVLLYVDLGLTEQDEFMKENFGALLANDTYVASDGRFMIVSGFAGGKIVNVFYDPTNGDARYSMMDYDLPDSLVSQVIQKTAESQKYCYKNELTDLIAVMEVLKEAISK